MKTYTPIELAEIIEKHGKWLRDEDGGELASLSGSDLSYSNLRGSDLRGSNLRGSNLRGSNLRGSNLSGSNLRGSNLSGSDLSGSNLRGSDLSGSNLRGSNLSYSDLSGSNLSGSDLSNIESLNGVSGNCNEVKALQCDMWPVTYTSEKMQIGCQFHNIGEWWSFCDDEIDNMDSRALAWWSIWKPILKLIIETSPAVPGRAAEETENA